jgi:hypothetical protein
MTLKDLGSCMKLMFHLKNMSTTQDFVDVPQKSWSYNVVEA